MTEQAGSDANECRADAVPADNIIGQNTWEAALAPDGTLIERFADFSVFC